MYTYKSYIIVNMLKGLKSAPNSPHFSKQKVRRETRKVLKSYMHINI